MKSVWTFMLAEMGKVPRKIRKIKIERKKKEKMIKKSYVTLWMFNICSIEGKVELDMCPVKIRELRKYLCFVRVFAKVQIIGNFDH